MSYLSIGNLYKTKEILLFKNCYALEKIHGTSAHILWKKGCLYFFSGGTSYSSFVSLFNQEELHSYFTTTFTKLTDVIVYGEVYGGKLQRMSHIYGASLKFICFEVKVDSRWLSVPNAEDIVKKLNLEFVHYAPISTNIEVLNAERDTNSIQAIRNGMGSGKPREGIVLRSPIELTMNNGERIIAKHKCKSFSERVTVPKIINPEKLNILNNAEKIANEWVVPMRLQHVLQKLPEVLGIKDTVTVLNAVVIDVYKEAKGEIIESPEVASAIKHKAVKLWKAHLESVNLFPK